MPDTPEQLARRKIGAQLIASSMTTTTQTRIAAKVERGLSVVEELETVVSAKFQRPTRLHQSILQKAFTGEFAC